MRQVEGCIAGPGIAPRRGRPRAPRRRRARDRRLDRRARSIATSRGRPLAAALAAPLAPRSRAARRCRSAPARSRSSCSRSGSALSIVAAPALVARAVVVPLACVAARDACAASRRCRRRWSTRRRAATMYLAWLPALALACAATLFGVRAHDARARGRRAARAAARRGRRRDHRVRRAGARCSAPRSRRSCRASPRGRRRCLLMAAHGAAAVALAVLATLVRPAFDRRAPPGPPRSAPAAALTTSGSAPRGRSCSPGSRVEVVELDEVVRRPHEQLVRPLDDRPLRLLVDRDRAGARRAAPPARRAAPARGRSPSSGADRVGAPTSASSVGARSTSDTGSVRWPRRDARDAERERDAHERRVRDPAVGLAEPRILAERLAVIAREHDDRRVGEPARRELVEQVADLAVDRAEQRAVAERRRRRRRCRAPLRAARRHLDLVVLVDVEVVQPDERRLARRRRRARAMARRRWSRRADVIADVGDAPSRCARRSACRRRGRSARRRRSA